MNVRATSRRSERLDARDAIAGACSSRSAGQAPRVAPEPTPTTRLRCCVDPANDVLSAKLASGFSDLFSRTPSGFLLSQAANTNWENDAFAYEVASESSIARDYDPTVGRWVSKDPSRFVGGLNLYAYAYGDPVNFVDPSGLTGVAGGVNLGAGGGFGFVGLGGEIGFGLFFNDGGGSWNPFNWSLTPYLTTGYAASVNGEGVGAVLGATAGAALQCTYVPNASDFWGAGGELGVGVGPVGGTVNFAEGKGAVGYSFAAGLGESADVHAYETYTR